MKSFASKMTLMAFAGLTAFSTGASANEHEISLSAAAVDVEVDALGTSVSTEALRLSSYGVYDNGLRYDLDVTAVEDDGVVLGDTVGELNARYMVRDNFGFAGSFDVADEGDMNVFGVGLAGEYEMGSLTGHAAMTSDVENFLEDFKFEVGTRYQLNDTTMLRAEVEAWTGDMDSQALEIGARYTLSNDVYLEGAYRREMDDATDVDAFIVGVGFGF